MKASDVQDALQTHAEKAAGWHLENLEWRGTMERRVADVASAAASKANELDGRMREGFARLESLFDQGQADTNVKLEKILAADAERTKKEEARDLAREAVAKEKADATKKRDAMIAQIDSYLKIIGGGGGAIGLAYAFGHFVHVW